MSEIEIWINRMRFASDEVRAGEWTGQQIRELPMPSVPDDHELFKDEGGMDIPVAPSDRLTLSGGEKFYSIPKVINPGAGGTDRGE